MRTADARGKPGGESTMWVFKCYGWVGSKGATEDIMWKKLELARSLAEIVWPHWKA
jgi:hypothetical protein